MGGRFLPSSVVPLYLGLVVLATSSLVAQSVDRPAEVQEYLDAGKRLCEVFDRAGSMTTVGDELAALVGATSPQEGVLERATAAVSALRATDAFETLEPALREHADKSLRMMMVIAEKRAGRHASMESASPNEMGATCSSQVWAAYCSGQGEPTAAATAQGNSQCNGAPQFVPGWCIFIDIDFPCFGAALQCSSSAGD